MDAKFATSGQDCLAANRVYVQRPLLEPFVRAFTRRLEDLQVGAGLEPGADIGPLIHGRAVAKMEELVADASARGAQLVCGGRRHAAGPNFFQPTLLVGAPDDARVMREEVFGPIASVARRSIPRRRRSTPGKRH